MRRMALVLFLSLALVACGGSTGGGTASTAAPADTTDGAETPPTTEATEDTDTTEGASDTTVAAETEGAYVDASAHCKPEDLETNTFRMSSLSPDLDTATDQVWLDALERAGVEIEFYDFEDDPTAVRAVAAGEADVVNTSALSIMRYIQESGGGLQVLAAYNLETDYRVVGTPEMNSLEDLPGRTFGVSVPGDVTHTLLKLVLDDIGIDESTIEIAEIGGTSARIAALAADQIDAGMAHYADALLGVEEFGLNIIGVVSDHVQGYAQRFLAGSPDWVTENPGLVQCVVSTLIDAQRWAADNKDEFVEVGTAVSPVSEEIASNVYDALLESGFFGVDGGLDGIRSTLDIEVAQGNLEPEMGEAEFVNSEFVENYLSEYGEYSG